MKVTEPDVLMLHSTPINVTLTAPILIENIKRKRILLYGEITVEGMIPQ